MTLALKAGNRQPTAVWRSWIGWPKGGIHTSHKLQNFAASLYTPLPRHSVFRCRRACPCYVALFPPTWSILYLKCCKHNMHEKVLGLFTSMHYKGLACKIRETSINKSLILFQKCKWMNKNTRGYVIIRIVHLKSLFFISLFRQKKYLLWLTIYF